MSKAMLGLFVCFIIMAVIFAADIAMQYLRIKRKFKKEHVRIAIMQRIYLNQEATNRLWENKRLANYPVLREYLKINLLMAEKLENGVALENFPVQKKKTNEKTSRERKLSEGMLRELTNVHKTDEEVFKIVNETAGILQKIFQFQHPIEFLIENVKTKVTVNILLALLKMIVELDRIAKNFRRKTGKKADNTKINDVSAYMSKKVTILLKQYGYFLNSGNDF